MTTEAIPPKKILVEYHGHHWPVYPLKCRKTTVYRVMHRVNGERRPKSFSTLEKAKADALSILKEIYAKGDHKIHLTADEKLDWKSAMAVLKEAGIKSSLETVCRHYADLAKTVGSASLLTDVARSYAESRGKQVVPAKISALRDAYLSALKKRRCSTRHIEAQKSHTGQFKVFAGEETLTDKVSREMLQGFIDSKKKVDPRTKKNLLDAVKALMIFGKTMRQVPVDWEEADHVVLPALRPKTVQTYTAEQLKKLMAAATQRFRPILALAAFAGIRSSEIENLDWKHIRLLEKETQDRIIRLDVDVTEESSKRNIQINETLRGWLTPSFKLEGKLWTGTHHEFYRTQQEIAKAAGFHWKQNALRHTFISAQVAITKNVANDSGNSVSVIKRFYLDLMPPSVANAWFAVTWRAVLDYEEELENQSKGKANPVATKATVE